MGWPETLVSEKKNQKNQGQGQQDTTEQNATKYPETAGPFSGAFFPHDPERTPLEKITGGRPDPAGISQWQFLSKYQNYQEPARSQEQLTTEDRQQR